MYLTVSFKYAGPTVRVNDTFDGHVSIDLKAGVFISEFAADAQPGSCYLRLLISNSAATHASDAVMD